jgi:hypothetical protein
MRSRHILLVIALALFTVTAQAQNRKPRVPDNYKGTGASVYDLGSDLPEDASTQKSAKSDTTVSRTVSQAEPLVPNVSVDENYVLQAEASSPLDKLEVIDDSGKVLRTTGLHNQTKASIDLNQFPKETLHFKFYGVNGVTEEIELSH